MSEVEIRQKETDASVERTDKQEQPVESALGAGIIVHEMTKGTLHTCFG